MTRDLSYCVSIYRQYHDTVTDLIDIVTNKENEELLTLIESEVDELRQFLNTIDIDWVLDRWNENPEVFLIESEKRLSKVISWKSKLNQIKQR